MTNEQKVFNRVYRGLAKQGWKKALDQRWNSCQLLDDAGNRCAIGHLVPIKDLREREWDENDLDTKEIVALAKKLGVDRDFLRQLQGEHDNGDSGRAMRERFRLFAQERNLTCPM